MKHTSVKLDTPIEFLNIEPLNPLISKCQIKVCYVGDEPNRNHSVITKEVAKQMANSLPGCPIVGFYNENREDFEEHNRVIDISNGEFLIKDTTRPYGFVDMNAKVWFQKFKDDDSMEHEYLMTEGWLWTGTYPECQRVISQGNNQSMELDENTLKATWSKDEKGNPEFFIINEAIISKLCILGEENEPCFEGSTITKVQFSFEDGFKEQLFAMMKELKDILNEGGTKVFNVYAVAIGDELWEALYHYIDKTYPSEDGWCSKYCIDGVFEDGEQKFAILRDRNEMKYYRLDFSLSEAGFTAQPDLVEVTKTYVPAEEPQFALTEVEAFEAEFAKKKKEEKDGEGSDKEEQKDESENEDNSEGKDDESKSDEEDDEEKKKKKKEEDEDFACGGKKKKTKCSLTDEEVEDLQAKYAELENNYNLLVAERDSLVAEKENLISERDGLKEFKLASERKDKEAMIAQFYMLDDADKKDVIDNIDTYSLDDIEKELSVVCVRKKVNFASTDDANANQGTTFNLDSHASSDDSAPAWVKAALKYQN